MTNELDCRKPAYDVAIAWDQDPDIALASERSGQRGGYLPKTARFHVVGKFGGDEQDLWSASWNWIDTFSSRTYIYRRLLTSASFTRLPPLSHRASPVMSERLPFNRRLKREFLTSLGGLPYEKDCHEFDRKVCFRSNTNH